MWIIIEAIFTGEGRGRIEVGCEGGDEEKRRRGGEREQEEKTIVQPELNH